MANCYFQMHFVFQEGAVAIPILIADYYERFRAQEKRLPAPQGIDMLSRGVTTDLLFRVCEDFRAMTYPAYVTLLPHHLMVLRLVLDEFILQKQADPLVSNRLFDGNVSGLPASVLEYWIRDIHEAITDDRYCFMDSADDFDFLCDLLNKTTV